MTTNTLTIVNGMDNSGEVEVCGTDLTGDETFYFLTKEAAEQFIAELQLEFGIKTNGEL